MFEMYTVVYIIQTIASITVIIDDLEIIMKKHHYNSNGIYNFAVLKTYDKWMMNKHISPVLNFLFEYPNFLYLISFQLVTAVLIVSNLFLSLSLALVVIVFLIHLLSHLRNRYGLDGSDQMQVIIFASLVMFYISSDLLVKQLAIFFICFQSVLSYFTAGYAKLISSKWRDGTAIIGILNTQSYGNRMIAQILIRKPMLSKLICWCVIVFECVFPFLIFGGVQTTFLFVITGVLFHLSIAILMGLNSFLWSFVATYPAIIFFGAEFQRFFASFDWYIPKI